MKKIFENIRMKSKELLFVALNLIMFFIIMWLFDVRKEVFIVLSLMSFISIIFYLLSTFDSLEKEKYTKERIFGLEKKIRELEEKNTETRNDIKDYFLSWIHQVKTPITSLNLLAETLNENERNQIKMISLSIENYTDMALSYLNLSDFSADINIKTFELSDIVKKLIRKYRVHFIETNTKLIFKDFNKMVISDKKYLELMLEQIINNAVKYASGKEVYIGYKDNYLYIKDTGYGIKNDEIKMIFNRGYSSENSINPNKSSGIGLYIVKRISQKLNHRVLVDSTIGHSTEFRIYFND
ncbi:sensor histidine kinase [Helcococcus kunzii]|uniref:sensor histidine kinase n=1 Tax=Helcococcus kunzii TaxID=40091 RepID=UPI0021A477E3|nr:HAMP domain-containing sensor histidine kinase [Helcococcus kunzii]MCT1796049.1 HAMP domain-containing histidine kinase [Helcococcus kunzii]MCT1988610.1 HAMP domain-containing histidine kinase [Helcococcus kunzii]